MYVMHLPVDPNKLTVSVDNDGNLIIHFFGGIENTSDLYDAKSLAGLPDEVREILVEGLVRKANAIMLAQQFVPGPPREKTKEPLKKKNKWDPPEPTSPVR